ncbi:FMN-dependent NADH-azoreductase [Neptunomonas qingdaonensis]|uniref:FMN dependent NADH:quinone oxidoreductase n=1 Tax=Neptunomonas qingdaonensis TaxID=1045558 RepID=A0A1I2T2R1_9GAMM|nr:NAD(P)H-dependent oxidoreductase [Neptunomonas qingdaonensis]SFG59354.1 FMN-dependent NADH-azoreductase [Neptunomonas qingdaonensis]
MATLLHIKSSIFGDGGKSSQLAVDFIKKWQKIEPQGQVVIRDLINNATPHLDADIVTALMTVEADRSTAQQAVATHSDQLINEIRQADLIVIGVPMYNFGIPSQMKAYLDQLARAGVTFKYTDQGPIGLLEDKPVYLFATRGGLYRDSGADFQIPFMTQFLNFIGLKNIDIIYAEGLNMGDMADTSLAAAKQQIAQAIS